jgi:hypothetical protein
MLSSELMSSALFGHRKAVDAALAGRPSAPSRTDFGQALGVTLDGRPYRFLLTAAPIPEFAPHRNGAVVVLDDVTEFARDDRNGIGGTGIGLYLCREIVRAHGGSIRCEAGDGGVGTRVAFSLPTGPPA